MRQLTAIVLLAVLVAAGCRQQPIIPPDLLPPRVASEGPPPAYNELIERYNANLQGLARLWASTDVKIRWRDEDGDARFEDGEGKFLFVPPRNVAITVEKLGKTFLWAGSDSERFWLFERQADYAYLGRHANVGKPCAQPLPLPVHPATVPYLLGLLPLEKVAGPGPKVRVIEGYYVIEPPGLALQMMLDPQTALPARIDLLNADGDSVIVARLRNHQSVPLDGVAADAQPKVPADADLYVMRQEARLTMRLERFSADPARIQPRAFEFEALRGAMKPKRVVELDADCAD